MDPKQEPGPQDEAKTGSDRKQDRDKTSKALGQAFLNHQIKQLETGANRNNKQNRRGSNRTFVSPNPRNQVQKHANSNDPEHSRQREATDTRIVVDASVLIHALDQIKKWSAVASSVQLIIPLEGNVQVVYSPSLTHYLHPALNSLDLLKKGNSTIATRARAASRLLEELVGSNSRVHVQEDASVVDWDDDASSKGIPEAASWVRNTLGCVLWEQKHHTDGVKLAVMDKLTATETSNGWDIRSTGAAIRESAERLDIPIICIPERSRPETHQENGWYNGRSQLDTQYPGRRGKSNRSGSYGGRLVEKPPAPVITSNGVRLLARGEMLAP